MNGRITALLLSLCLLLTACNLITAPDITAPVSGTVLRPELASHYSDRWCYRHLDDAQKQNYAAVYQAVYDSQFAVSTVRIAVDGTETVRSGIAVDLPHPPDDPKEIYRLYDAFTRDHPQFFFIGNLYGYEGSGKLSVIKLTYTMDMHSRKIACDELSGTLQAFLLGFPSEGDDYQKELWLHDKLLKNCVYDTQADAELLSSADSFTAYGALVKGKAVCEGYSRAMLLLLQSAGISATVVCGTDTQNNPHMWNFVNVNGQNYHLDATWNDTDWGVRHTYFNLSTAQNEQDHFIEENPLWTASTIAYQENFYQRNNALISTYDLDVIANAAAQQLAGGTDTIELKFSPSTFNNGLLFVQSHAWFSETVDAVLAQQELRLWDYEVISDTVHNELILLKKDN